MSHLQSYTLWGKTYTPEFCYGEHINVSLTENTLRIASPCELTEQEQRKLIESFVQSQFCAAITCFLSRWEAMLSVRCTGWNVRQMRTRWGSCSVTTGKMRFNAQLMKKPMSCLEYVVVHELCHFIVPNHSAQFWECVARCLPDWKERRALLNAETLHEQP